MQERRYLLNIGQMLEGDDREALLQEALGRIDKERSQKVLCGKSIRVQAAGIGAGLLIQKALADYCSLRSGEGLTDCRGTQLSGAPADCCSLWLQEGTAGQRTMLQCFSVRELLGIMSRTVREVHYCHGERGKPYLRDFPFYFNLSHSGDYVFCGVSKQEIGVDIQKIQKVSELRLARRFFSDREYRALENCGDAEDRRKMFFCMWVRKEAFGKLTGEGLAGAIGTNLREEDSEERELDWEEYDIPEGYRIAVCKSGRISGGMSCRW